MSFEGFQFGSHIIATCFIPSLIEGNDADMVATNQKDVFLYVIQRECEDAVQIFEKVLAFFAVQSQDDFAIGLGHKLVFPFEMLPDFLVVVYLTIHGQYQLAVLAVKGLLPGFRVDNRQALVRQDGLIVGVNTRPVRTAVPDFLRHLQHLRT
ncbi:hypothetical protein SDC9_52793 [bioreactor metagenome]|uniref:Uncharacterized protein n=1 Tax=bioreactor metagenome TaxID=1076179 RepID=A0A644WRW7_9ZZZZ